MSGHDPLWTPSEGHVPAVAALDWLDELEWVFADNTEVGQVTPGGREHRKGRRVLRPYVGRVFWGGARFRTTSNLEREGRTGPSARLQGGTSVVAMRMHGLVSGAEGVIVPVDQLRRAVDHLISRMAPSVDADTGISEWSLAVVEAAREQHFGVWFSTVFGASPEDHQFQRADEFCALADTVDVEFAFAFGTGGRDDERSDRCTFWGSDGRWLAEFEGAVHLEKFDQLDWHRGMAQQQVRSAAYLAAESST